MENRKVLLAFCVAMVLGVVNCGKYPQDLPRCNAGDNACLPGVIMEVLEKTKGGKPELNLPSFEPLFIPQVSIIQDKASNIPIELYFKNCNLYGISKAIINKTIGFEKDPKKSKFELHARVPRIELDATYKVEGKVLILPITGAGKSNLTLENVDIKVKFAPIVVQKNGKDHITIPSNKFKLVFETSRMYLRLDGLFNGNKALSDNMNLFLNENWQIILQELKPAVRTTLSQIIASIFNSVFDKVPYQELFKDTDV